VELQGNKNIRYLQQLPKKNQNKKEGEIMDFNEFYRAGLFIIGLFALGLLFYLYTGPSPWNQPTTPIPQPFLDGNAGWECLKAIPTYESTPDGNLITTGYRCEYYVWAKKGE